MQAIGICSRKIRWGFYVSDNYDLCFFGPSTLVTLGMHICRYAEGKAPTEWVSIGVRLARYQTTEGKVTKRVKEVRVEKESILRFLSDMHSSYVNDAPSRVTIPL